MSQIVRIGIIDDHQIVIDGLKLLLNDQSNLMVLKEDTDALHFLKSLKDTELDVIITDVIMPHSIDGVAFSLLCKQQLPELKILVLSMCEEGKIVNQLIQDIKVDGYLSKAASKEELIAAISCIANGEQYYSDYILQLNQNYLSARSKSHALKLSHRELEILHCIAKHLSNKQIAETLFISERTVETHRKNIYRKTSTKGEAALIALAIEHGWL